MKELKELILNVLVFLSGIYAVYIFYQAVILWGKL
jgi:hypothetical protein